MTILLPKYKARAKSLASLYTENKEVFTSFKPSGNLIEYSENVDELLLPEILEWENLILAMIEARLDFELLEALIYCELIEKDTFLSIEANETLLQFFDYFLYRKDVCQASEEELDKLYILIRGYEILVEKKIGKKVKKRIRNNVKTPISLKNILAQELLEKGSVEIDGKFIKLWRGHTRDSVSIQQDWNNVQSLAELNKDKADEKECVAFSGIFQIPRSEVFQYASDLGFRVQTGVNSKTTLFVFGSENVSPTKIANFLDRRTKGQAIEIMDENAFLEMVLDNQIKSMG
jgi:NAD-dependent DNA ligase